ncbi:MAG: hypothetical protein K9J16_01635 [Melioribacteraceae bacterium]|nr:hypothetical protein [Melioribacteraceae bacterium]MCF8352967.1 hypothetical protein [Melioribacteraceae bacterium]MCF8395350.1 hypothetical protein [Melioribacteraceae bacterium]MCF8417848.1 hypothetical protein [Melioribacteraceae bacterium]
MLIAKIIFFTSAVIWAFPIFRQVNSRFFYFFFVLGLADLLRLSIKVIIYQNLSDFLYGYIISALLIISLVPLRSNNKNNIKIIFITAMSISLYIFIDSLLILTLLLHVILLEIFLAEAIIKTTKDSEINLYLFTLVFYELLTLSKLLLFFNFSIKTFIFGIITLAFQTFIAVFFVLFTEDSKAVRIKLKR